MVDWDRVEELRSKGWDWDRIADDPKVGFHPETSVTEPGRALRGLYHRQRSRQRRRGEESTPPAATKQDREKAERKWTIARIGFLLTPIFGIWFVLAYLLPSPVGVVLGAVPVLALILVGAAFLLIFGLFRSSGPKWSKAYRSTLVMGVVLGLVITGVIGLTGYLFFSCPVLPSSGTPQAEGWMTVGASPWQESGKPVFYFFGATWCPYCSASSWAMWKALSGFGSIPSGTVAFGYSAEDSIPYVDLSGAQLSSSTIALVVNEDTSGVQGNFPTTSNCVEQAYVSAYSGSAIPFVVINGQYVHGGATLIQPSDVSSFTISEMQQQTEAANGTVWGIIQSQTWWMMAYMAKSVGATPSNLAQQPYYAAWADSSVWGGSTQSSVLGDLSQIS